MADAAISLGVVIERRALESAWQDYAWRATAVLPDPGDGGRWRELYRGNGATQFLAGSLNLELFKGDTEGYRSNLSQPTPMVFVVLRPGETAEEREVEPFRLTACPYEAMSYLESGEEIVEGVPMPADVIAWLQKFVAAHHVDEPFKKRKNKRFDGVRPSPRRRGRQARERAG